MKGYGWGGEGRDMGGEGRDMGLEGRDMGLEGMGNGLEGDYGWIRNGKWVGRGGEGIWVNGGSKRASE